MYRTALTWLENGTGGGSGKKSKQVASRSKKKNRER